MIFRNDSNMLIIIGQFLMVVIIIFNVENIICWSTESSMSSIYLKDKYFVTL